MARKRPGQSQLTQSTNGWEQLRVKGKNGPADLGYKGLGQSPNENNNTLGFHFRPKPQDCCEYLICKVASKPLPCDGVILDLNPYDAKQLDEIFKSVEKRDEHGLFTFTKLRKRTSKMHGYDCPRRKVGKGIWHPEKTIDQGEVAVEGEEHTYIGFAQKLSYREKGSKKDRRFLMMEYSLLEGHSYGRQSDDGTPVIYDPYKDYVLCHVVKKGKKRPNNDALAAVLKIPTPSSTCSSSSQSSETD